MLARLLTGGVSVGSDDDTIYSTSRLMAAALNYSTTFSECK